MVNSVYVIGLWHRRLCTVLSVTWLMPASSYVVYVLAYYPHWCVSSNFGIWHICGIWGHICCWHIFCSSVVNKCCSLLIFVLICTVIWGLYVDYSRSAVGHMCDVVSIFSWAYASNIECMYTSAPGHFISCSEFIWGIYTYIVVCYLHMK